MVLTVNLAFRASRIIRLTLLAIATPIIACAASSQKAGQTSPKASVHTHQEQATIVHPGDTLTIADPTIFPYAGKYYLIGTSGDKTVAKGFKAFVSRDLSHWRPVSTKDQTGQLVLDRRHNFGDKGFWAPQLLLPPKGNNNQDLKETVLIAYTANEQIAIARSKNGASGPYTQNRANAPKKGFTALFNDGFKHIDPYIFTDAASGKTYIYYVKLNKGNNIYVNELKVDPEGTLHVKKGTEKPCIRATEDWENTAGSNWPVTEGPTVCFHHGYYYLFYSANDFRNVDYAVGYATAKSPTGPWVKSTQSPVISRKQTGLNGTGHGDIFKAANGQFYYVFHAHNGPEKVGPRKTFLIRFAFLPNKQADQPDEIKMDFNSVRPLLLSR